MTFFYFPDFLKIWKIFKKSDFCFSNRYIYFIFRSLIIFFDIHIDQRFSALSIYAVFRAIRALLRVERASAPVCFPDLFTEDASPKEMRCMLWSSKLDRSRLAPYCLRARTFPPFFSTESAFAMLPPGGRCRPTKLLPRTGELFCKIVVYTAYEGVFSTQSKTRLHMSAKPR